MRLLGQFPGFVGARPIRERGLAELPLDEGPNGRQRLLGHADRIGPHIGNQPDRAFLADFQPFVEILRHPHGPGGGEAQLVERFLLQGAGDKRRLGVALLLLLLDVGDHEGLRLQGLGDALRLLLRPERGILVADALKPRGERLTRCGLQRRLNRPILLRGEGLDLLFAIDDQPQRDRLHAAGGQPPPHLLPQQRRERVAHEPIENPAGLLGIDFLLIDRPGMLDRGAHRLRGDLMEGDPENLFGQLRRGRRGCARAWLHGGLRAVLLARRPVGVAQQVGQMPADRLAFPVGVRREIDGLLAAGFLKQLLGELPASVNDDVVRGEVVLDVDAELAGGQVHQMPHRGGDVELPA